MTDKTKVTVTADELRQMIIDAKDYEMMEVDMTKEWGCVVYLRSMTARNRDKFTGEVYKDNKINWDNMHARLVAMCMTDAEGSIIFREKDIKQLGKKDSGPVVKLFDIAQKMNGLGLTEDTIKETAKNLETTE